MKEDSFKFVDTTINNEASLLDNISQEIWKNPELKFEETFAHDFLTNALEEKGFIVERNYILPTAFRAEFDSGKPGAVVAVICEYDALPEIGHACGHNLIAEAGFGAGIAIKASIQADSEIPGKVVVLGTPAEEGGGGKIFLIAGGAFKDIDVALMVHPSPTDHLYPPFIGLVRANIKFIGKAAHASGYPWEGVNALDAAVACYNNLSLLRQQIKPTCRIHGIISNGGEAVSIIPGYAELQVCMRAATTKDLEDLRKRTYACAEAGANAAGCQIEIVKDNGYKNLMTNKVLAERYKKYAKTLGVKFMDGDPKVIPFMASSDMGDVSHAIPSIHPTYSIGSYAPNHSVQFTQASATPEAQVTTLITAKSMALLALDVMTDKEFLSNVKEQFEIDVREDAGLSQ